MPSLYELSEDYEELQAMLEVAETDEDMEAIQNTLDMLDCSIYIINWHCYLSIRYNSKKRKLQYK